MALNVLLLYDAYSTFTQTVVEHLRAFPAFSKHRWFFAHASQKAAPIAPLDGFDAIVIHYSVRVAFSLMAPAYVELLRAYRGVKVLFIQDEYDQTETTRTWIESLALDVVFTCVPAAEVDRVYPAARFPKTRFVSTLTGFVPPRYEGMTSRNPIRDRSLVIAYRGRPLPFWYGKLGREKLVIGQQMKEICSKHGIPADIEWSEEARIYGERWYDFLASAKATLGTESGSNVFDDRGSIRKAVEQDLRASPELGFDAVFDRHLAAHEGRVATMNQISPKMFEAIALGTVLVLYEGRYSGILEPGIHYVPLRKDLGNVEEVLAILRDDAALQRIADRAYADIIASGRWSYRAAVAEVDAAIERARTTERSTEPFLVAVGVQGRDASDPRPVRIPWRARLRDVVTTAPITGKDAVVEVGQIPGWMRFARRLWAVTRVGRILEWMRGDGV